MFIVCEIAGSAELGAVWGSYARTNLPSALTSASFNADNQLTQFGSSNLTYDANGNLTSDGTNTYTWDARNHLVSIGGGVSASFQYDPFGRRVSKAVGATSTQFLYDGANSVQELMGGTPTANLLAGGVDQYFQRTDLNGPLSFFTDALGSTLALTSSAGVTVASYTYDPFGGTTVSGGSANPNQYTGRENDGTGLYYYRARYYNPRIGRFISEDPLGLNGGTKLYAYAGNDPVDLRDPTGQNPMCVASGLAFMSIHNIGIIGKTLSGRKIDYYSGWSGLGHIATEDATAFLTGCLGGVVLEAALPAAAVLPTATGVATAATAASTILQNQANGQAFEDTVIDVIGATKNTMSITVEGLGTSIPDVIDAAGNIIEIKNAINLSYTTQLQIQVQGAQGSVSLIVSPITQYISGPLRDAIARTGGTIQVFNPATGAFTPWH